MEIEDRHVLVYDSREKNIYLYVVKWKAHVVSLIDIFVNLL